MPIKPFGPAPRETRAQTEAAARVTAEDVVELRRRIRKLRRNGYARGGGGAKVPVSASVTRALLKATKEEAL